MDREIPDKNGRPISVGTRVRLLAIPPIDPDLSEEEVARVNSMLGEEFNVYEIDVHGRAWVEKWWHIGADSSTSHSLALESRDMERVDA